LIESNQSKSNVMIVELYLTFSNNFDIFLFNMALIGVRKLL